MPWKLTITSLLVLFYNVVFPQAILRNYNQTYNNLSFDVELVPSSYTVSSDSYGKRIVKFQNNIDESLPGQYALPQKDLFIALPAYSKAKVSLNAKASERIQGIPYSNPLVVSENDSSIKYIESQELGDNEKYLSKSNNTLFEIKGYLWIRDYYCIHLRIRPYQYNNSDYIEFQKSLHLEIKLLEPVDISLSKASPVDTNFNNVLSSVILNFSSAKKLNKTLITKNSLQANKTTGNWIDFGKTYLKLAVAEDGIYRLKKSDLSQYGINTSGIDPSTFKLFCKGKEYPIYVFGEQDRSFDDSDYIEFAGRKNWGDNYRQTSRQGETYKEYLNRYSDTTIYWLAWGGQAGLRADSLSLINQSVSDTLNYYCEIAHYEENRWLDYSIDSQVRRQEPYWKENQTWVWGQQSVGTSSRDFTVSDIYPDKSARAFYKVQSFGSNVVKDAHRVGLSINSNPAVFDSLAFNKYEQKVVKASFSSNLLKNGTNKLNTISFPTQNTINTIEYDWYEVEYPRYLKAIDNSLCFQIDSSLTKALRILKVQNVSSGKVSIYKFSNGIKRIPVITKNGSSVFFTDTVSGGDKYFLSGEEVIRSPKICYLKQFDDIASSSIQADYIILTASELFSKASEYAQFIRENYNVQTKVIDVKDIYDQYNYGFFSPEPIRDFLIDAYNNWKAPKPSYLLLAGDANYDYYGNKTKYDKVPFVKNFVPSFGEPVSDSWFVIWDSTGAYIPQMYLGRLPVGSVEEFEWYLEKHRNYLTSPFDSFNKQYLFLSGGDSNQDDQLKRVKSVNDYIISELVQKPPIGGNVNHLYKTSSPRTNFGPYSYEKVNEILGIGGVFVSYLGHSGTQIWDNGIIDVEQINNKLNRPYLVTDFGCSTGKFAEPDIRAFSELFVVGLKGNAIAYVGNSSLGFETTSFSFPQVFYETILRNNITSLGAAHVAAKIKFLSMYGATGVYKVFALTNSLFTDPIIKLRIPPKPNLKISAKDIAIQQGSLVNSMQSSDSIKVKIGYLNTGRVDSTFFRILILDNFNGSKVYEKSYKLKLPLYQDSLEAFIPVKDRIGKHILEIKLDADNQLDELFKDDNQISTDFIVSSNQLRSLISNKFENRLGSTIQLLNPVYKIRDSLVVQYDSNPLFTNPKTIIKRLDTLRTNITLTDLIKNKRYWIRTKFYNSNQDYADLLSFIYDETSSPFYISDSVSMSSLQRQFLSTSSVSGIKLDNKILKLNVYSAGFYDGGFAVVELNGNDLLSDGHLDGVHCAVFDEKTMTFLYSKRFSYWDDATGFANNLTKFLDSIDVNKVVVMANCGGAGGYGMTKQLVSEIKMFGSILIDSVQFRHSWAMIGKKGALTGSVPEKWTKPGMGQVKLDSSFTFNENSGYLLTGEIGPSGKWKTIKADYSLNNSKLEFFPLGIKSDSKIDTLKTTPAANGVFDLSSIDPKLYKKLQILTRFSKDASANSPELRSLAVDFDKPAELMINYQSVELKKDTLQRGQIAELNFSIFNAGETSADSFKVKVEVVKPDNSHEMLFQSTVASLLPETKKDFNILFNTAQASGNRNFLITLDSDNKINELFKDNNYFLIPFYISPDTTRPNLKLTFDGRDIFDGEYVSSKPEIRVELSDNSFLPITDTTALKVILNDKLVNYTGSNELKITYNSQNPKAVLNFKPTLSDGEYTLRIFGKNGAGNLSDSSGIIRIFQVSNDIKLMDLYNYPNPFSNDTYFTFKLTQIPDEMKIKIYTVAGRMIREIIRNSSELKFDFNKIYWDGKDQDGDILANGVYLYKIVMRKGDKTDSYIQKFAIVR
ncbi:MAG: C25 family cysteine peptidase [Bacteroidota bacterium]|nr:C25 family cysteine peptidase [Bacteroidota bacterium]MDP4194722.1 C25 family cysteine peptidase [Bacteroidota bacterium]